MAVKDASQVRVCSTCLLCSNLKSFDAVIVLLQAFPWREIKLFGLLRCCCFLKAGLVHFCWRACGLVFEIIFTQCMVVWPICAICSICFVCSKGFFT